MNFCYFKFKKLLIFFLSCSTLSATISQEASSSQPDTSLLYDKAAIELASVVTTDHDSQKLKESDLTATRCLIKASDYCDFLNASAITDKSFLYNEKMGSDPIVACIMRSGLSEHYRYDVISGRENVAMPYVNESAVEQFADWKNSQSSEKQFQPTEEVTSLYLFNPDDFSIACNQGAFYTLADNNGLSSLHASNSTTSYFIDGVAIGVSMLASFFIGRTFMTRCCNDTHPYFPINDNDALASLRDDNLLKDEAHNLSCLDKGRLYFMNRSSFSEETITISDPINVTVPKKGNFQAGWPLRRELEATTRLTMLETLKATSDIGLSTLKKDILRAKFTLHNEGDPKTSFAQEKDFKDFVGLDHPQVAESIARIMNQTLFADVECMTRNLPHQLSKNKKPFSSSELHCLEFIYPRSTSEQASIEYDLEKKHDGSFGLTATYRHSQPLAEGENPPWMERLYFFSYSIKINPDFSEDKSISLENFPCHVTCNDFQLKYKIIK